VFLADVIGTVVSPVQHPVLEGRRLLLLRPLGPEGTPYGRVRIGIDRVRAGVGDRVLVIDEGNSARQSLDAPDGPVKTIVAGVVDSIELGGRVAYDPRRREPVRPLDGGSPSEEHAT